MKQRKESWRRWNPIRGLGAASDWITVVRILVIPPVSLALYLEAWTVALTLFGIGVLSDVFDGPVARLLGTQSSRGAAFDGVADIALILASVCWIWWLFPERRELLALYVPLVAALVITYFILSYRKTGGFLLLHLLTGKLTGVLGYGLFPLVALAVVGDWYLHLLAGACMLFYLESILYVLREKDDPNGRSAFF